MSEDRREHTVVGVVSDTHGLLRTEAVDALRGSDVLIHAGDVDRPQILDELRRIAPLHAVRGNCDHGAWAADLPLRTTVEVAGVRIFVVHRLQDLEHDPAATGDSVVVFGHSHQPEAEKRGGVLYLNPGSAGPRRFRLPVSVARLEIEGRDADAVLRHEIRILDV